MARNLEFCTDEFYHICNRGVDKRNIFLDKFDFDRFIEGMDLFNRIESIGSIYENSFIKHPAIVLPTQRLVSFIAYCINPNHYHFLLEQLVDNGIERFMHRISGYSRYFNHKYKRSGALFQGAFKAVRIDDNDYLLHVSAYINLNHLVHGLGYGVSKSSWEEYLNPGISEFCKKDLILDQFKNIDDYKKYAEESVEETIISRKEDKDLDEILLD